MVRFLFTRRWLGLLLAVVVVGVACVELSRWQFRRYAERHDANQAIERNLGAAPLPASAVLSTTGPPGADEQWRVVEATGTYDADRQVLVLYRTREGAPGVDVVVPLVTDDGTGLLVDRGWVATTGNGNQTPSVPPPPAGEVAITGWVRASAQQDGDQTTVSDGSVRAVSADAIGAGLPYRLYDGFVDLTSESPQPGVAPDRAAAPDLGSGPSFFYGLQWLFFGLLALGFWLYFAWSEWRARVRPARPPTPQPGSRCAVRR